jgi:hypothetical protein
VYYPGNTLKMHARPTLNFWSIQTVLKRIHNLYVIIHDLMLLEQVALEFRKTGSSLLFFTYQEKGKYRCHPAVCGPYSFTDAGKLPTVEFMQHDREHVLLKHKTDVVRITTVFLQKLVSQNIAKWCRLLFNHTWARHMNSNFDFSRSNFIDTTVWMIGNSSFS